MSDLETRISLLWKAYVFKDKAHLASFQNHAMDLTLSDVVDIYLLDLREKGVTAVRPSDPFKDTTWRKCLDEAYPQPFSESAAGDYN